MAAHTFVKLEDLLQAVIDRIIAQVSGFNTENCYLSINPDATPEPNPGDFICVVAPTSGIFDEEAYAGGGSAQATVNGGIITKIHSPVQLDQAHRDASFLAHASLGLLKKWRLIVKCLLEPHMLQVGSDDATRGYLIPGDYTFTRKNRKLGAIEQTYKAMFDLDLNS